MQTFMYTIKVPVGLHARHAGLLVKEVSKYGSAVTVTCGGRSADGRRILALMGLGVHQGDVIRLDVEGADEREAALGIKMFLWEHF